MHAAKYIPVLLLAASLSIPAFSQGGKQGPPPGQRRGGMGQGDAQFRRPGPHFGQWLRDSQNLSPEQKQKQLQNDPNFQKLPPERQQKLMQRLQQFNALPPAQQQRLLNRMEVWEHMTPEQHRQARALFDRMQGLPDERRTAIREEVKSLSGMPPEQRQKVMDSDQFKRSFNDDERSLMQGWMQLRDQRSESTPPNLDEPPQL